MKSLKDINTTELAEFLNVTAPFASRIKNGKQKLPHKKCLSVSRRFDIDVRVLRPDVFGEIEEKTV